MPVHLSKAAKLARLHREPRSPLEQARQELSHLFQDSSENLMKPEDKADIYSECDDRLQMMLDDLEGTERSSNIGPSEFLIPSQMGSVDHIERQDYYLKRLGSHARKYLLQSRKQARARQYAKSMMKAARKPRPLVFATKDFNFLCPTTSPGQSLRASALLLASKSRAACNP